MVKVVLAVNVGALAAVVAVALVALHGGVRLFVVGVLCAALTIGMYAAPMAAMVSKLARRSLLTHPPPPPLSHPPTKLVKFVTKKKS